MRSKIFKTILLMMILVCLGLSFYLHNQKYILENNLNQTIQEKQNLTSKIENMNKQIDDLKKSIDELDVQQEMDLLQIWQKRLQQLLEVQS